MGITNFDTVQAGGFQDNSGNSAAYQVVAAGEHTWTGGGATDSASVSGVVAGDVVLASIESVPTEAAYLAAAAAGSGQIDFTLSAANTSNDAVISYAVLRAVQS